MEILRLDWSEVDLAGGLIEIKAKKAKTASRRLVPIPANLKKWLMPRHREYGKVVPVEQMSGKMRNLARKKGADLKWKHNALRHSYISYRVAETQNVAQTALEAGNSPKMYGNIGLQPLLALNRCPHCGVDCPNLSRVWETNTSAHNGNLHRK